VKSRSTRSLNRREFNGLCGALGSFVVSSGALAPDAAAGVTSDVGRTVRFPDGTTVPALGQGSWHIGQGRHSAAEEEEALRTGLSLGMTLIDTSGNYGEGRSEELIKHAIAGQRDRAFVVSKVEANDVTGDAMARAYAASLARLGTDHLDLYLLHWPTPNAEFSEVVTGLESLRAAGKRCPTSPSVKWKTCSIFHKVIAAQPIRSLTTSAIVASNMTCCHGASSTACR
jgi:aryl-alcohol dehydrogenase-like predicted oxidoreductase